MTRSLFLLASALAGLLVLAIGQAPSPAARAWPSPTETSSGPARVLLREAHRLSNPAASQGGMLSGSPAPAVVAAGSRAHALWAEAVGSGQYGLFYRGVPLGGTRRLAGANLSDSATFYPRMAAAADGRACFAWQPVSDSLTAVWCTDYGLVQDLARPVDRLGLDNQAQAHAVGVDDMPGLYHQELFYWSEATGQTIMLSEENYPYSHITSHDLLVQGATARVAWIEYDAQGQFAPFYWDNVSAAVRALAWPDHSHAESLEFLATDDGAGHLFWMAVLTYPSWNTCPQHWDTVGQVTGNLGASQDCYAYDLQAGAGPGGDVHVVWKTQVPSPPGNDLHYWSSAVPTTTQISTLPVVYDTEVVLATGPAGLGAVAWSGSDLYLWDSGSATTRTLSDALLGQGPALEPSLAVDDAGTIHVAWLESAIAGAHNDLFYWDSQSGLTRVLSAPSLTQGDAHAVDLHVSGSGLAHLTWAELEAVSGQAALFYWDSGSGLTQTLVTYGADPFTLRHLRCDLQGRVHAVWLEGVGTPAGSDLIYWSTDEGRMNLSAAVPTQGDVIPWATRWVMGGNDQDYLFWIEDAGPAEGDDLFGAWVAVAWPQQLFVPAVTR